MANHKLLPKLWNGETTSKRALLGPFTEFCELLVTIPGSMKKNTKNKNIAAINCTIVSQIKPSLIISIVDDVTEDPLSV
jgi:hypothetical protein